MGCSAEARTAQKGTAPTIASNGPSATVESPHQVAQTLLDFMSGDLGSSEPT